MTIPPPDRKARRAPTAPRTFLIQPLWALDGVLLHVSANGETVGFYFGQTESAARDALAADVVPTIADGSRTSS